MSLQSRLDALVTKIAQKNNKLYDLAEKNANKAQDLTATGATAQTKYTSVKAVQDGLSTNLTSANNYTDGEIAGLSSVYVNLNEKGAANGVAPLDANAKITEAYLPDTVLGQLDYQGTITGAQAAALPVSGTSNKGHYYVASEDFTKDTKNYKTGDWIVSNGTAWEKVDNTDAVATVHGRMGNVVAVAGDYSADLITYNNAGSTLVATNADAALDELDGKVEANEAAISSLSTSTSNDLATKLDKGTYTTGTAGDLKNLIDTNTTNIGSNDTDISNIMSELNTFYKTDGFGVDFADYATALENAVHVDLQGA